MNMPGPTPKPILGNIVGVISKGLVKYDEKVFDDYKSDIIGLYEASTPVVLCRDVDMIKHVMIKDFSHFINRRVIIPSFRLLIF